MFTGETMQCHHCPNQQQSHPEIESGWYKAVAEGKAYHICPRCAGMVGRGAKHCDQCNLFYNWHYTTCPWCAIAAEQTKPKGFGK